MIKIGCMLICFFMRMGIIYGEEEFKILGSDIVEIAIQGESVADYEVPEGFTLQLQEDIVGVRLQQQRLVVNKEAQAAIITLLAQKDEIVIKKEVALQMSWTKTVLETQAYCIPDIQDTRRITYMDTLIEENSISILRYSLCTMGISLFIVYLCIRKM